MANTIKIKRGTNAARLTLGPVPEGELIYTTDTKKVYIGDGATNGGVEVGESFMRVENIDIDSVASEMVAQYPTDKCFALYFDYVVKKAGNMRVGTVMACHDGVNVTFTETSTNDLGNTSDVTLYADISGGNLRLMATTLTNDWIVKALVRYI